VKENNRDTGVLKLKNKNITFTMIFKAQRIINIRFKGSYLVSLCLFKPAVEMCVPNSVPHCLCGDRNQEEVFVFMFLK